MYNDLIHRVAQSSTHGQLYSGGVRFSPFMLLPRSPSPSLSVLCFYGGLRGLLQCSSMFRDHSLSCCSCNGQNQCKFVHGGGSRSFFATSIHHCGNFVVLRTTKTVKNGGKKIGVVLSIRLDL